MQPLLRVGGSVYGFPDYHVNSARPWRERRLRQELERAPNRNRNNRYTRAQGDLERAGFKLLKPAIRRARAFGKDRKRLASAHPFDDAAQAARRLAPVASVNREVARTPEVPPHEGHVEELFLSHYAELERQVSEQRRYVDQARMIRHVNVALFGADVVAAQDSYARPDCPGDQAAPPPRTPVLHRARAVKGAHDERDCRHHYRIKIPEQVGERCPQVYQYCFQLPQGSNQTSRSVFGQ